MGFNSIWAVAMLLNGIRAHRLESRMGHRIIPEEMKPAALPNAPPPHHPILEGLLGWWVHCRTKRSEKMSVFKDFCGVYNFVCLFF